MKLTLEEAKTIYNYLSREWLHYDDQAELRLIVKKIGQYIEIQEIVEDEIRAYVDDDEGRTN